MTHLPTTTEEAAGLEPQVQTQHAISKDGGNPLEWLLDLFSSIWLGVVLMSILFVYCAIGSVGVWLPGNWHGLLAKDWVHEVQWFIMWTQLHVRQAPGIELTEFEWFHWWPFNLLITLICINIIVATLRRIPLNVINLGVWMIHSGIIILAVGSVIYFSLKLEGDAPVIRRQIVAQVEGHAPVRFAAQPGTMQRIEVDGREYLLRVMNIDPEWELLSGDDAGKRVYMISVAVQSPEHQFVRQLIAGYPQYTEDTIWTGREDQPMVRAIRELGTPFVDESIQLSLDYHPQEHFYLMNSRAIYLRERGSDEWIARPIHGLPRYNDRLDSFGNAWTDGRPELEPSPIEIRVDSSDPRDPLAGTPIYITSYLRYAVMQTRHLRSGSELNPMISLRLRDSTGQVQEYHLEAFNDEANLVEGGRLHFVWASSESHFQRITRIDEGELRIRIAGEDVDVAVPVMPVGDAGEFAEIEGTEYAWRLDGVEGPLHFGGEPVSVAIVSIKTPERIVRRWVFDSPDIPPRDFAADSEGGMHGAELALDERVEISYRPRNIPRPVTLIAGPADDELRLLLAVGGSQPSLQRLVPGRAVSLQGSISLEVLDYVARARAETRPYIVPIRERDRDPEQSFSVIRAHIPDPGRLGGGESVWLPHHHYAFQDRADVMRRFPYRPTEVELPDGRVLEVIYSRDRRLLPAPVVLEEFEVKSHIGGFTGETASIRDWVSRIRFQDEAGWTDPMPVSMNKPASHKGYWYFQAKWDPPDPARGPDDVPSAGRNYTVLGVGNRHGVWIQLFGCCVAVAGMIYAFYIKPILKRRRQQEVFASMKKREVTT